MARFSGLTRGLSNDRHPKVGTAQLPSSVLFGSLPVFNVLHPGYGAKGDGTTDDTAAVQAAHDALKAAGGGVLYFPMTATGGVYLLNGSSTAAGVSWAVALSADNIRVIAAPGVTYKTTINAATFFFGGCLKPGGAANWASNRVSGSVGLAIKALTGPIAAGATSITCATPADAGTFAAGDWIYVRTGETVAGVGAQSNPTEPDAEINQVLSANAGTGVIVLKWPLSKPFAQEYFSSGVSLGPTTTAVTAFPAPFGVSKITDRVQQNVIFEGGKFLHTGDGVTGTGPIAAPLMGVGGIFGLQVKPDPGSVVGGNLTQIIEARKVIYGPYQVHFSSVAPSYTNHTPANADTGCTDVAITGVTASAEKGVATIELHEGCSIVKVDRPTLLNPSGDTSAHASIEIAGRVYDVAVDRPTIVNAGNAAAITVDGLCPGGGKIIAPTLRGTFPGGGIVLDSPGWRIVGDPDVPDGVAVSYTVTGFKNPQTPLPGSNELTAFIDFGDTDVRMGPIPANSYVKSVRVQAFANFNAGTTNNLSIGVPAAHGQYVAPMNVGIGAGIYTPTLALPGWSNVAQDVHAYFVQTGTAATTGRALVTLEYARSISQ